MPGRFKPVESDPGKSAPCPSHLIAKAQDRTVLLPLYDDTDGTGDNASYRISGYAAFHVTGYYFSNKYSWNDPCSNPQQCIRGYFTKRVNIADSFDYSPDAPDFGTTYASLTG